MKTNGNALDHGIDHLSQLVACYLRQGQTEWAKQTLAELMGWVAINERREKLGDPFGWKQPIWHDSLLREYDLWPYCDRYEQGKRDAAMIAQIKES